MVKDLGNTGQEKCFACWFRLNGRDGYLIWISGEPESVLLNNMGKIPVFTSETLLAAYATAKRIVIENETPLLHNLDAIEEWLHQPETSINCQDCLSAWNLFSDVAYTLQISFSGDKTSELRNCIYDKLFYGNNTFNLTPDNQYYILQWCDDERNKLSQILREGLLLFKSSLTETKE